MATALLVRNRNFRLLFSAGALTNLGDGLVILALPWLATLMTDNALMIGAVAAAGRLPWLLFAIPAGVVIDRVDRRKLIARADLLRAVIAFAIMLLAMQEHEAGAVWLLAGLAFLLGSAEVIRDNAAQTILPSIVASEDLEKANGQLWSTEQLTGQFIGPPLAGVLIASSIALPFGIAICAGLMLFTDRTVYRFYRQQKAKPVIFVIVSLGIMFIMNGLVRFIIGPNDQRFADGERFIISVRTFKEMTGLDEGLAIKTTQGITVVTAVIVVAALFYFLNRTRTGKSMRAYSDNEDLALLSGINPERVVMVTWLIVAALATIAGVLYGLDKSFKPFVYSNSSYPSSLLRSSVASALPSGRSPEDSPSPSAKS